MAPNLSLLIDIDGIYADADDWWALIDVADDETCHLRRCGGPQAGEPMDISLAAFVARFRLVATAQQEFERFVRDFTTGR